MTKNDNKVVFVGAGAGDPELITVKGKKALENADIVIYAGSLVNPMLLDYCPEHCEIHNSAYMNLDEVLEVTVKGWDEGKKVVRLHTGDPSIYGAIQEQIEPLNKRGIETQVIPGVSSFLAAAAALQQEYTLPGVSQSLILTRMEGRTPVPEREKLSALASHRTSMCIFLSVGMIEKVVGQLLEGGYPSETPIAVIQKASWEDEKTVAGTLNDIAEKVKEAGINKTAMIMVGDFLKKEFMLSKLYDPSFTTEFREGKK